jgi:hypothetical protein
LRPGSILFAGGCAVKAFGTLSGHWHQWRGAPAAAAGYSRRVHCARHRLHLTCAALIAALAALLLVPALASATPWEPHARAAAKYAAQRNGIISFQVRTAHHTWGWHARRTYPSASVLKAMLLVTYLRMKSVRARPLSGSERSLLGPMIRRSSNSAASTILGRVGTGRLSGLARVVGMHHFTPVYNPWGLSRVNAEDQTKFFLKIDRLVPRRHRKYAMFLLSHITPSQRWGIGRVEVPGWRKHYKGGWGSGTGWVDHQVVLLVHGKRRIAIAVLTHKDGSHAYGKETLRAIFARLLRGLGPRSTLPQ